MKPISIFRIAAVSLFVGSTALAFAQQNDKQDDKNARPQTRAEQQQQQKDRNAKLQQQQEAERTAQQKQQQDRATQAQQQRAGQQGQRQDRKDELQQQQGARVERASQDRQKQQVALQTQRLTQYRQHLDQQQRVVQQQTTRLQQQKRVAQYRSSQDYLTRLRQQRAYLNDHHPDYDHDPFFFSVSTFRYNRGGRFYETNKFGADLLRQGVNFGYQEGFNTGVADREDRWAFNFENSYAYQDANYGYNGYYVEQADYNFYFREGFRRGYEDGFYRRSQYGHNVNGSYVMLEVDLSKVLGFVSIH